MNDHSLSSLLPDPCCVYDNATKFDTLIEAFPAWLDPDAGVVKAVVSAAA